MSALRDILHESTIASHHHHHYRQRSHQRTQHFTAIHDPHSGALINTSSSRRPRSPSSDISDTSSSLESLHISHHHHGPRISHQGDDQHSQPADCCYQSGHNKSLIGPEIKEAVRRNHRKLDLVNRSINSKAVFSQVHPKMREDGSYPADFMMARTVDDFEALPVNVIDRILNSYGLICSHQENRDRSRDLERGRGRSGSGGERADRWREIERESNRDTLRRQKLARLYEFLGADQLVENSRIGRESYVNWS